MLDNGNAHLHMPLVSRYGIIEEICCTCPPSKIIQSKQLFFHFMIGAISITVTFYRSEKTPNPDQSVMTSSIYR